MRTLRPRPLVPVLLLSGACLLAGADGAAAAQLSCGDVVTHDVRLSNDLIDCPGDGLVIGADDITVSLGGHLVDGQGAFGSAGIDDSGGYDGVRVQNGTVREFQTGVELDGTHGATVRGMTLQGNFERGIWLDGFAAL